MSRCSKAKSFAPTNWPMRSGYSTAGSSQTRPQTSMYFPNPNLSRSRAQTSSPNSIARSAPGWRPPNRLGHMRNCGSAETKTLQILRATRRASAGTYLKIHHDGYCRQSVRRCCCCCGTRRHESRRRGNDPLREIPHHARGRLLRANFVPRAVQPQNWPRRQQHTLRL